MSYPPVGLVRSVYKLSFHNFYPRVDVAKPEYGYVYLFL